MKSPHSETFEWMTELAAPERVAVHWNCDPALLSAQDEYELARQAWEAVAPADGQLSENPTPLQRLLYARVTTSEFIFLMARRRANGGEMALP
jgi:hypothetical protein